MSSRAGSVVAPLYLLACLVLGGSAQGIWQNMVLQLAGLAIIAWAAAAPSREPLPGSARLLLVLAMAAIGIVALQQLPLPPAMWASGRRAHFADGYRLLGQPAPALPTSLTPYESLSALLCMIPPLAIFCAIVRQNAFRPIWLAAALLLGAASGIVLGVLQAASPGPNSQWYLYAGTNTGSGVGFFANASHMASLLVIALPFVAAIGAASKKKNIERLMVMLVLTLGALMIVGIALVGSLVGYALALPVLLASMMIVLPQPSRLRSWAGGLAGLAIIGAITVLASSAVGDSSRIGQDRLASEQSREVILETTGTAIVDHMPLGAGLGSFPSVYRMYEKPEAVTSEPVVHAHNDYAELILELGVPGILLLLLFLGWWIAAVGANWRDGRGEPFARAASIASGAVLVQSLVDFPLRTAAISSCFAMCLALMANRRFSPSREANELRPARHVVFT